MCKCRQRSWRARVHTHTLCTRARIEHKMWIQSRFECSVVKMVKTCFRMQSTASHSTTITCRCDPQSNTKTRFLWTQTKKLIIILQLGRTLRGIVRGLDFLFFILCCFSLSWLVDFFFHCPAKIMSCNVENSNYVHLNNNYGIMCFENV